MSSHISGSPMLTQKSIKATKFSIDRSTAPIFYGNSFLSISRSTFSNGTSSVVKIEEYNLQIKKQYGVKNDNYVDVNISSCIFSNIRSETNGGALLIESRHADSSFLLTQNNFIKCEALDNGGAVYAIIGQIVIDSLCAYSCGAGICGSVLYLNATNENIEAGIELKEFMAYRCKPLYGDAYNIVELGSPYILCNSLNISYCSTPFSSIYNAVTESLNPDYVAFLNNTGPIICKFTQPGDSGLVESFLFSANRQNSDGLVSYFVERKITFKSFIAFNNDRPYFVARSECSVSVRDCKFDISCPFGESCEEFEDDFNLSLTMETGVYQQFNPCVPVNDDEFNRERDMIIMVWSMFAFLILSLIGSGIAIFCLEKSSSMGIDFHLPP